MKGEQFVKLVDEMLFKNYQTTIAISDTTYFEVKHDKNYIGFERYTVKVNKDAIQELCGEEEE